MKAGTAEKIAEVLVEVVVVVSPIVIKKVLDLFTKKTDREHPSEPPNAAEAKG